MPALSRPVLALVCLAVAVGCVTHEGLARSSQAYIGCPEEEITIEDHHMEFSTIYWTARCRGRRFHCVNQQTSSAVAAGDMATTSMHDNIQCTPEDRGPPAPVDSPPQPAAVAPPAESAVTRADVDGLITLTARIEGPELRARLVAAPSREPEHLWLALVRESAPTDGCRAGLLVDGEVIPLEGAEVRHGRNAYELRVPVSLTNVEALAASSTAALRWCDEELLVTDEHRGVLDELRGRIANELAWEREGSAQAQ